MNKKRRYAIISKSSTGERKRLCSAVSFSTFSASTEETSGVTWPSFRQEEISNLQR